METIIKYETDLGSWVTNEDESPGFWLIKHYDGGTMYFRRFKAKNAKEAIKIADDGGMDFILDGGKDSWEEEW